jgi:hypothetical protein
MNILDGLSRYLAMSSLTFRANESMRLGPPTALAGAIMAQDSILPAEVNTPFGKFTFFQLAGVVHADEYEKIWQWSSAGILDIITSISPLAICDVEKPSFLCDDKIREEIGMCPLHAMLFEIGDKNDSNNLIISILERRSQQEGSQLRNVAAPTRCVWSKLQMGYKLEVDTLVMARVKVVRQINLLPPHSIPSLICDVLFLASAIDQTFTFPPAHANSWKRSVNYI